MKSKILILCILLLCVLRFSYAAKSYHSSDPVIQYTRDHSTALPESMQQLLNESINLQSGGMTGAPEVVSMNMLLIKAIKGQKALDVGLFAGYSALGSALAITDNGTVVGMDVVDTNWKNIGQQYAVAAGVLHKIDVRIKPAKETMAELIKNGQSGTYDFCFIDADKQNYLTYYEQCLTLLRHGGIITLDNVLQGKRVISVQANETTSNPGIMDQLNKKIANDNRVWATFLPIGDGMTIVLKK